MLVVRRPQSGGELVTENGFRSLALALPEAVESEHMEHPDFRVGGKIFATLGHPAKGWGMVKLSPEQQHEFSKGEPKTFLPVKGAWGRRGATSVNLKAADKETLRRALLAGWRNAAPKRLVAKFPDLGRRR